MALPPSPYTPSTSLGLFQAPLFSAMSSGGGGASPLSYQQRARELLARARAHGGGGGAMVHDAHGHADGIGAMAKDGFKLGATSAGFGAMDASEMGRAFTAFIYGVARPSTVAFVLGLGIRAVNLDKTMPMLRQANNTILRSMFPVLGYRFGERLMRGSLVQAIKGQVASRPARARAATPAKAGVGGVDRPVPGERTTT
jgi:hypothetical protein